MRRGALYRVRTVCRASVTTREVKNFTPGCLDHFAVPWKVISCCQSNHLAYPMNGLNLPSPQIVRKLSSICSSRKGFPGWTQLHYTTWLHYVIFSFVLPREEQRLQRNLNNLMKGDTLNSQGTSTSIRSIMNLNPKMFTDTWAHREVFFTYKMQKSLWLSRLTSKVQRKQWRYQQNFRKCCLVIIYRQSQA